MFKWVRLSNCFFFLSVIDTWKQDWSKNTQVLSPQPKVVVLNLGFRTLSEDPKGIYSLKIALRKLFVNNEYTFWPKYLDTRAARLWQKS